MDKFKWEYIGFDDKGSDVGFPRSETLRAKVVGGWLIKDVDWRMINKELDFFKSIVFISDSEHRWEIEIYE